MIVKDAQRAVPIPSSDRVQGKVHAEATLVECGDFQCRAFGEVYPPVKQSQRRCASTLRFVFYHLPLTLTQPYACLAADSADAGAVQEPFIQAMHDELYEERAAWASLRPPWNPARGRTSTYPRPAQTRHRHAHSFRLMAACPSASNGTRSFYVNG